MLSFQTISHGTLELLKLLSKQPEMDGMRLVGGTSLALQYGHRQSIDLDFFGTPAVALDDIVSMFGRLGEYEIINKTNLMIQAMLNGVKIDVVDYKRYQWIDKPLITDGIVLASPKDIAALKINAIEGRGSKKDFVDVYFLLQHYSLQEILTMYSQKYPNYSYFTALISLSYFEDAETQTMPKMFIPVTWENVKNTISDVVKRYQR